MVTEPHIPEILKRVLAMPKTHKVVTTYADGRVREFACHSLAAAENHSVLDKRKIGRKLLDRETGNTVQVVSVVVMPV